MVPGRGVFLKQTYSKFLLITIGGLVSESLLAWEKLKEKDMEIDVYNLRFLKPIDREYLIDILISYTHILLVEDGSVTGGAGSYISSLITENNLPVSYQHRGIPENFLSQALRSELLEDCGLNGSGIASSIIADYSEVFLQKSVSLV